MRSRVIITTVVLLLILFGAGCTKKQNGTVLNQKNMPTEPLVWLPTSTGATNENQTRLDEMRNALEAFQNVKSFKAKIYIDNSNGKTTGEIDVMKPERFHGTLQISKENTRSEFIGVGDSMYAKLPTGWIQIQSPSLAQALTDAFYSAMQGSRATVAKNLPNGTIVSSKGDAIHSCVKHASTIQTEAGKSVDLTVCIAQEKPVYIEIKSDEGIMNIEYHDYNSVFTIERPSIARP